MVKRFHLARVIDFSREITLSHANPSQMLTTVERKYCPGDDNTTFISHGARELLTLSINKCGILQKLAQCNMGDFIS